MTIIRMTSARVELQDQARKAAEAASRAAVQANQAREFAARNDSIAAKNALKIADAEATRTRREADAVQAKLSGLKDTTVTDC
jgi:hypothetical protein